MDINATSPPKTTVPTLQTGDRLSGPEFMRRYEQRPDIRRAELIEGVVHVASPLRFTRHSQPHAFLVIWAGTYCINTPGLLVGDNPTLRLDKNNIVQPDILIRLDPAHGGRSHLTDNDYVEGTPELLIEVAASSEDLDLHQKRALYARHGIPEYIVAQSGSEQIHWFILDGDTYHQPRSPTPDGLFKSRICPGLWLDAAAFWQGDMSRVMAVLTEGLASADHHQFVESLGQG